ARRAGSGVVRSPAAAWTTNPWAANSCARPASPAPFTSAMTSCAPARPNPTATACPIWPTPPTPVPSATLPPTTGRTGDDLVDRPCAALRARDRPVLAHDVDGALDPLAVVLER